MFSDFLTSTISPDAYTTQTADFKLSRDQDWLTDLTNKVGADTSFDSTIIFQIERAQQHFRDDLAAARSVNPNLDADQWMVDNYDKYITGLQNGDYKNDQDYLRQGLASDFEVDATNYKADTTTWINNKDFNSIYEKQSLGLFMEWAKNGFKGNIPGYLSIVGNANGQTGMEYAFERLEALGLWDSKNEDFIGNPEDLLELTKEEKQFLFIKPNATKNLLLLDDSDEDRFHENKLLLLLRKEGRTEDYFVGKSWGGALIDFVRPGEEIRTVRQVYELAQNGATDFGIYGLDGSHIIDAVDRGLLNLDDEFNSDIQDFLVLDLVRIQANKSNDIMGALTEGLDWKRISHFSLEDKRMILQFFPNLRNMPMEQFQNLQADISVSVLTGAENYNIALDKFIENNPDLEQIIGLNPEDTALPNRNLIRFLQSASRYVSGSEEAINDPYQHRIRAFFKTLVENGDYVPWRIRSLLQQGNKNFKDDFDWWQEGLKKDEEPKSEDK